MSPHRRTTSAQLPPSGTDTIIEAESVRWHHERKAEV